MKVIGRGSFGKVYMAKKKGNAADIFAVKVLDKSVLLKRNLLIKTQGKTSSTPFISLNWLAPISTTHYLKRD